MTKVCSKCKIEKDVSEFYKRSKRKDFFWRCKDCLRQYREENKEIKKQYDKQYYGENKEFKNQYSKQYNNNHKKQRKQYLEENKEYSIEYQKQYRKKNKIRFRKRDYQYRKNKYEKDVTYKLRQIVSKSINHFLKSKRSFKSGISCLKHLPYTMQQLKQHLEKQFEPWMDWENHGRYKEREKTWQIDHIIPHSSFHYETMDCDEFRKCWALENLKPLEAFENLKKGNKIV